MTSFCLSHLLNGSLSYCASGEEGEPRSQDSVEGLTIFSDVLGMEQKEMMIQANYGFQAWAVTWMRGAKDKWGGREGNQELWFGQDELEMFE